MTAQDRVYFIFAAHGWCGSLWLAYVLNRHKDITCTHSALNCLATSPNLHSEEKLRKTVLQRSRARTMRRAANIDEVYDDTERMAETKIYGSVHVFRLRDVSVAAGRAQGLRRQYRVKNLVRHPVSFVWSGHGELRKLFDFDFTVLDGIVTLILNPRDRGFLDSLADAHRLNLRDYEVLSFLGAAANLYNLALDVEAQVDAEQVRLEQLAEERDFFRAVVLDLAANEIQVTEEYLDEVFKLGPINTHRPPGIRLSPGERFACLDAWQREAFTYYFEKSGIEPAYVAMGYDFSFI